MTGTPTGARTSPLSRTTGFVVLGLVALCMIVIDVRLRPIPQPQSYHSFADQRSILGVPNFWNVVSNLPFAIVGWLGLKFLLNLSPQRWSQLFLNLRERRPYLVLFTGLLLTAFGSSYYHLHPDNATLVWDRLPMTIVFMSLISALISERISLKAGLKLLPLLLFIGAASVLQWYWSELHAAGDLRFYATVQAFAVVFLLIALCFPPSYTRGSDLLVVASFYLLAKLLETYDKDVYHVLHVVSGHTLKHIAAAFAGYWILRNLQKRSSLSSGGAPA